MVEQDLIDRLTDEKQDLDAKIQRLTYAINHPGKIGMRQIDLMRVQEGTMRAYSVALKHRIDDLKGIAE